MVRAECMHCTRSSVHVESLAGQDDQVEDLLPLRLLQDDKSKARTLSWITLDTPHSLSILSALRP